MSIFDSLLGTPSPTTLGLSTPTPQTSILDAALSEEKKEAATAPVVPKDTATAGVVDKNGNLVVEANVDKSFGKNKDMDVIGQASYDKPDGWSVGAWFKKTWGSK